MLYSFSLGLFAQEWTREFVTNSTPLPRDIWTDDINGDGLGDLIITSDLGYLYMYINDENTNFGQPIVLRSHDYEPQDIFVVDLDSDSDLDIVASYSHQQGPFPYEYFGQIGWFENDGLQNFTGICRADRRNYTCRRNLML